MKLIKNHQSRIKFAKKTIFPIIFTTLAISISLAVGLFTYLNYRFVASLLIVGVSTILILQSTFNLFTLIYAWEDADAIDQKRSPRKMAKPKVSFTALIPARHEVNVIGDTVRAVAAINYPEHLKETIVICREDDGETINEVEETIENLRNDHNNVKLLVFDGLPINKPKSLNEGLSKASNEVVVIFDAEDHPHQDIYQIVNTAYQSSKADVVQSGVQLMNYSTSWYSALNVLEYFFWFKSALHFFALQGIIPLGGNTVFFRKKMLEEIGGWDEECLTEDADIGIRLSAAGAKTHVIYDERHVTREETPGSLASFIKQRTRWNQGFVQVLMKGDWLKLPKFKQKALALYILALPELMTINLLFVPISIFMTAYANLPVIVAIYSLLPLYLLTLQLVTYQVGVIEFIKSYKFRFSLLTSIKVLIGFIPYQLLLGVSSVRGVYRSYVNNNNWEKTEHTNAHREFFKVQDVATVKG
jgi:glycosyltransferase XagB